MSRNNYLTIPKSFNSLTKAERVKAAQIKSAYYKKYNKPMPVRYVAPNAMVISKPNYQSNYRPKSELKSVDLIMNMNPVLNTTNTNGQVFLVNGIVPGTGSWNRIGKKIRMKSFRYKGIADFNHLNPQDLSNTQLRMTLVYDKQPSNGPLPTFDTMFGGTDQLGAEATNSIFDNQRIDNTGRFSVIKDDVFTGDVKVAYDTGVLVTDNKIYFDNFVSLRGLETIFSGQSSPSTIADISSGALYLIFRSTELTSNNSVAIANTAMRLRYYDL